MTILMMYRVYGIPVKSPPVFFIEIEMLILQFIQKHMGPRESKQSYKRKLILSWKTHSFSFQAYYEATVMRRVWDKDQGRHRQSSQGWGSAPREGR